MAEIELRHGTPFCDATHLNRLIRHQSLGVAVARASIYDEICQAVSISEDDSAALVRMFLSEKAWTPNRPMLWSTGYKAKTGTRTICVTSPVDGSELSDFRPRSLPRRWSVNFSAANWPTTRSPIR